MERRTGFPDLVRPMLATAGELPDGPGWAFEFKWDGVRAVAYVLDRKLRLMTRNDLEVSRSYPELRALGGLVDGVVLDGEVVALDRGRPSFGRLQSRMHVGRPTDDLLARVPVVYYVFDLLFADGERLVDQPYTRRRELLEGLGLAAAQVQVPPRFTGVHGEDVLTAARDHCLEGVVAKRVTSRYEPGRRSRSWIKVPLLHTQEVVIGGWKPGDGRRRGTVGSLLLGIPTPDGLHYIGKVGTGFTQAILDDLHDRLRPLEQPRPPFTDAVPPEHARAAHWTRPDLVGEVEYRTFTEDGRLRHASWRGLRPDKTPDDLRR
ncbi:non-homologous end-joining DNA ligase [Actinosynnema sp. CS-041913]|uniref:non-homologous end-joining DNA ligase n=1 Tax=Actinosynnema sp. CS-041913 TaxID=3239917 RepID=UPI003D9032AA